MQQRHKKKGYSKPIVPVHAALSKPGGAESKQKAAKPKAASTAKPLQQQKTEQQQQQQQQPKLAAQTAGTAVLGKRKTADSAQQQPHFKKGHGQAGKQQQQQHCRYHKPQQEEAKEQIKQQQHQGKKQQHKPLASQKKGSQAAGTPKPAHKQKPYKRQKVEETVANGLPAVSAPAAKQAKAAADGTPQAVAAAAAPPPAAAAVKPWLAKQPIAVSSNWKQLQQQLKQQQAERPKRPRQGQQGKAAGAAAAAAAVAKKQIGSIGHSKTATPIVAMDCEMVGVGPGGERDSLARVSIVNAQGNPLIDFFVAQTEPVTDYRTWVSGITPEKLVGAPSLADVQQQVAELLQGRTLVGHGLKKDLAVLMLSHPRKHIRDTSKYPPFMFSKGGKRRPRALRHLAQQELGLAIQEGQHSSVDDARAALYLYQKHSSTWERALKTPDGLKQLPTANRPAAKKKRHESYAVRDVKDDPMADL